MLSTRAKNRLYDNIQKGWVYSCIGVSLVLGVLIGQRVFNYYIYERPIKKELEEQFKNQLIREGMMKNADPVSEIN